MIDKIVGLVMVSVATICITILAREWLVIQSIERRRAEQKKEERRVSRDKRFHDSNESLYLETKAKLDEQITKNRILEEQLRRQREVMDKVKIADLGKGGKKNG